MPKFRQLSSVMGFLTSFTQKGKGTRSEDQTNTLYGYRPRVFILLPPVFKDKA